jgi:hypothetical protein
MFIEMSKAFDCLFVRFVHDIFLEKLYKSGVRGNFYELAEKLLIQPVPAGSYRKIWELKTRYSLLFFVYINDIFELNLRERFMSCFTDLYDDMQHVLDILNNWLNNNCLTANSGKTNFTIFKDPQKIIGGFIDK